MTRRRYRSRRGYLLSLLLALIALVWALNAPFGRGLWPNVAFVAFVALGVSVDRTWLRRL
jgi:hypothetical protein